MKTPEIMTYAECLERWTSDYQIRKEISEGRLYKIEKGIYSDCENISTLAVISAKYPAAVITMENAFYYHGLTDVIPERFSLATDQHSARLSDSRIHQYYIPPEILYTGAIRMTRRDAAFLIYDRERMLVELLRYKNKLPFDYYKEILRNYRVLIQDLDVERIQKYASEFPKSRMILDSLEREVF